MLDLTALREISVLCATNMCGQEMIAKVQDELRRLDIGTVGEAGVPVAAALGRQVHEVPHGSKQVDATLLNVRGHSGMRGVEVPDSAVSVTSEDGNSGILIAVAVFATEVELECAVAGAEKP